MRAVVREGVSPDQREAAGLLLEGAMSDVATAIHGAQEVMAIPRAARRGSLDLADLLPKG